MNTLTKLQDWYFSQCDEDWEHSYGVKIETLDNPGWTLTIDLTDTELSGKAFSTHQYGTGDDSETSGNEWLHCKVESDKFVASGGPSKLEEMINVFLAWSATAV